MGVTVAHKRWLAKPPRVSALQMQDAITGRVLCAGSFRKACTLPSGASQSREARP